MLSFPDWFTLQFGGVQRQIVDMMNLETSCAERARAIRGVVADAAQAPVGPQGRRGRRQRLHRDAHME